MEITDNQNNQDNQDNQEILHTRIEEFIELYLQAEPYFTHKDLAREFGVSEQSVSYFVRKLPREIKDQRPTFRPGPETREKMRKRMIGNTYSHTEEAKEKIRLTHLGTSMYSRYRAQIWEMRKNGATLQALADKFGNGNPSSIRYFLMNYPEVEDE